MHSIYEVGEYGIPSEKNTLLHTIKILQEGGGGESRKMGSIRL